MERNTRILRMKNINIILICALLFSATVHASEKLTPSELLIQQWAEDNDYNIITTKRYGDKVAILRDTNGILILNWLISDKYFVDGELYNLSSDNDLTEQVLNELKPSLQEEFQKIKNRGLYVSLNENSILDLPPLWIFLTPTEIGSRDLYRHLRPFIAQGVPMNIVYAEDVSLSQPIELQIFQALVDDPQKTHLLDLLVDSMTNKDIESYRKIDAGIFDWDGDCEQLRAETLATARHIQAAILTDEHDELPQAEPSTVNSLDKNFNSIRRFDAFLAPTLMYQKDGQFFVTERGIIPHIKSLLKEQP